MTMNQGRWGWAFTLLGIGLATVGGRLAAHSEEPALAFERIVIDSDFPGGYQVEVADVNGDAKPDIVALGGGTCAWYENPSWKKRIITSPKETPGIISSATADVDGDGKAEVAIGFEFAMNDPTKGKLGLAVQGKTPDERWSFRVIDTDEGSIHRLRWGKVFGDETLQLVVAPIFGLAAKPPIFGEDAARLEVHYAGSGAELKEGRWSKAVASAAQGRKVMHAIEVKDADGDGRAEILTADNAGVSLFRVGPSGAGWDARVLIPGAPGNPPKQGCSEVHLGQLRDGRRFLATIDPWHGNEVAVSLETEANSMEFGARAILDDTLADGHALWVADTDGDGDDEVFAGHRGKHHRISYYDYDQKLKIWRNTVLDSAIAAQDLRGGDLDGNGVPDVVGIGGATKNVVWYRPLRTR